MNLRICRPSKAPEAPNPPSWGAGPSPGPPNPRWSYSNGSQQQRPSPPSPPVAAISSSSSTPAGKPVQAYDIGSEQDAGPGSILFYDPFSHCLVIYLIQGRRSRYRRGQNQRLVMLAPARALDRDQLQLLMEVRTLFELSLLVYGFL